MFSKIPFSNEKKRKGNLRRLCKFCCKDFLSNLACSVNVPESFLMCDRRQCSRCHKEKIKGSIFTDAAFASSTENEFDDLCLDIGQLESWHDDVVFPQFNETSSDFLKGHLIKTTKKIEKLDGPDSAKFVLWAQHV